MPEARRSELAIGVDLGGTKTEIIALSAAGEERFRRRIPTPDDYDGVIAAIRDLVLAAKSAVGPSANVGVGAPGSLSPQSGLWRNCNLLFCNGRDLPGDLAAALGRPVRVENDANCFALSEALDGAGAGARVVYGITAGTGLGGGLVVDRQLVRGANGAAAEVGHLPLAWIGPDDWPLAPCYCGLTGCTEQYLSGSGLSRDYREKTGEALRSEAIFERAEAGEPAAVAAIDRLFERFARFLSVLVNILDPDVTVLGGGLSKIPGFCAAVAPRVPQYTFARDIEVRFVRAVHGDSSGVRGAARLWGYAGPVPG